MNNQLNTNKNDEIMCYCGVCRFGHFLISNFRYIIVYILLIYLYIYIITYIFN